jgi:ribosomal protein S18 acetylase RimI-like enzyme
MIEIRSLDGVGWDALATAFNDAFSDYAMPTVMTAEALAAMQTRRGYVAAASFGAYDDGRLVGFALTCLDGDRAYNSGTGVAPAHRRGGVARRLVEAVIAIVPTHSYLLEVIEDNTRAVELYQSLGFVETRRLACWSCSAAGPPLPDLTDPDLDDLARDSDVALSCQNSLASIRRAPEPYVVIGDEHGAAVIFPASADLALLTVPRRARRQGHGTRLLGAAVARASRPLRILNIDARATGIARFLDVAGATPLVRQIEMMRRTP